MTELSYVKGVTSSIQTQINAKGTGTVTSVVSGAGLVSGTITTTGTVALSVNSRTRTVGAFFDGGGSTPAPGKVFFVIVPYSGTITAWSITSDVTGSAVIDVWKVALGSAPGTVANTIAGSDKPTLSSAAHNTDSTLTGWGSTTVTAGDVVYFHLDSSATLTQINVALTVLEA